MYHYRGSAWEYELATMYDCYRVCITYCREAMCYHDTCSAFLGSVEGFLHHLEISKRDDIRCSVYWGLDLPRCITAILSALRIVERRCAITILVLPFWALSRAYCTTCQSVREESLLTGVEFGLATMYYCYRVCITYSREAMCYHDRFDLSGLSLRLPEQPGNRIRH